MYQQTNTLSAHNTNSLTERKRDESQSRKRRHKKEVYNSKNLKPHSKQSHSKRNRLEVKLKNSHLKNYDSDYLGPNRLTKHMGFLAKGKISDSISRLEEVVPENLKARTKQDLHRILELNNSTRTNTQTSDSNYSTSRYRKKNISSDEESNSNSTENTAFASPVKHSVHDARNDRLGKLSLRLKDKKSVFSSESKSSSKRTPQESKDEVSVCREIITKKLHSVVTSVNNLLFPNSCNQTKLISELLAVKTRYESSRKIVSSSSNCESSQDNACHVEGMAAGDFQLNPVLTQENSSPKQLENMFPVSRDYSSESEDEVYVDAQTLLQKHSHINRSIPDEFDSKPVTFSSSRDSSVVLIPSSVSSNGSPVWDTKMSPVKFIPEFPPTPKLYFRQKMF